MYVDSNFCTMRAKFFCNEKAAQLDAIGYADGKVVIACYNENSLW